MCELSVSREAIAIGDVPENRAFHQRMPRMWASHTLQSIPAM